MQKPNVISSPLQAFLVLGIAVAAIFHLTMTLSMGFISDDFVLMKSAREGSQLWHLHYAPLMELLWRYTAEGKMCPLVWHFITLTAHGINTFFVFHIGRVAFKLTFLAALFAAVLFAYVPIGLEALTWISASGYPLMTCGFLAGIALLYQVEKMKEDFWIYPLAAALLALLQATTFLTWDWAILVAPIFALFGLFATTIPKRKLPLLLGPALLLWGWAAGLRVFSKYGNAWQNNDIYAIMKFSLGSPLLALFPNVSKEWFTGIEGITAAFLLLVGLFGLALRHRTALVALVAYYFSIAPWIFGGNPSSRYFYFPVIFIYLILALAVDNLGSRHLKRVVVMAMVLTTLTFSFERLQLWKEAEGEAQKLRHHIQQIVQAREIGSSKPLVIVNLPDAFGPPTLPLRPQMWYCGFDAVIPGISLVKTDDCSFIWHKDPGLISRSRVAELYNEAEIYEIILQTKAKGESFSLIPFSN